MSEHKYAGRMFPVSKLRGDEMSSSRSGASAQPQHTPGPWEPAYIPDDLDPIAELGRMIEGGNGRVYYVYAPQHPRSNEQDGMTVIAITGNGPDSEHNARWIANMQAALAALAAAAAEHAAALAQVAELEQELAKCKGDDWNKTVDYLLAHAPDPEPPVPEPPDDWDEENDEDRPHYDTPGGW